MDDERLQQERTRAEGHELRRTILGLLGDKRRWWTLPELATAFPEAGSAVLPKTSAETVVAYHLRVLQRAQLIRSKGLSFAGFSERGTSSSS